MEIVGAQVGLACILWDIDPIDWRERKVERIVRRVLDGVRDGAIVDFHDGWPSHHTGIRDRTPTVDALRHELARAQQVITDASGVAPRLVRPPYGEDAERVGVVGADIGLACILWDVDPIDWRERKVERIVRRVFDGVHDGAIVDFHDGWPLRHTGIRDRTPTVDALRQILPELVRRGYEAVTVSAMSAQPATQTSSSS